MIFLSSTLFSSTSVNSDQWRYSDKHNPTKPGHQEQRSISHLSTNILDHMAGDSLSQLYDTVCSVDRDEKPVMRVQYNVADFYSVLE